MRGDSGNLFAGLPDVQPGEVLDILMAGGGFRLVRIISTGQATPQGEWYDQAEEEWVVLLQGAAGLRFEDEAAERVLSPGDWVSIPAHRRHRVEWTAPTEPTVWLALHCTV
ncbi:MAG: cupin domain-containing protein [Alphaproteobacteria bacterium]